MYFYHGNRQYYLTRVFLDDKDLQEVVYANGLLGDYEQFAYSLAEQLHSHIDSLVEDNELSANEYYEEEYSNYSLDPSGYISQTLSRIQTAIYNAYNKVCVWYHKNNKGLYVAILKSVFYGSIKHFFYENKNKYLPQYDWYLINNNPKRKDIMEMLFREFDKFTNVADALKYYQDPDDIPLELVAYLQEITGLSMNDYNGVFTDKQLRSLIKHIIEVWREKGASFSIELFFSCMGIQCDISELWFDKRMYDNPKNFNEYTKVQSVTSFGYYLTPNKPHTVSYEFSPVAVNYSMYTNPKSSRIWEYRVDKSGRSIEEVEALLGISGSSDITYTYFKSNFVLINFYYIGSNRSINKDELDIFKELINHMLPVYIRTYYGNENEQSYGNDDWDIINAKNNDTTVEDVVNGKTRDATPLGMFDTQLINKGTDFYPYFLYDAYPSDKVGEGFVSGSYMVIYDDRYSQYFSCNNISLPVETIDELVSSPEYDVIGGKQHTSLDYPAFHDIGGINYSIVSEDPETHIVQLISQDGTEGTLVIPEPGTDVSDIFATGTLVSYYFKDNNDNETRIYPNLFVDDNNGSLVRISEGIYDPDGEYDETFSAVLEPQLNWTYDIEETSEVEELPYETFDISYTNEALNLFETSNYYDEPHAVNNLYDGNKWKGDIQYEYYEYTNPLEYIDSKLNKDLQITLI